MSGLSRSRNKGVNRLLQFVKVRKMAIWTVEIIKKIVEIWYILKVVLAEPADELNTVEILELGQLGSQLYH